MATEPNPSSPTKKHSACRSCRAGILRYTLFFDCLLLYFWRMLDVERIVSPGSLWGDNVSRLVLPLGLILTLILLFLAIRVVRARSNRRKGRVAEGSAILQAHPGQQLAEHRTPWTLRAARLGLISFGVLGILIVGSWPQLLVGGWVSLALTAACVAYVRYFGQQATPARSAALRQRALYNLRCYLCLLPCYLMAAEAIRLWWPENIPAVWLLLPWLALYGVYRRKFAYCTSIQASSHSKGPSWTWIAILCGLLALLSLYMLAQPLPEPTPIPYGFFLFLLLSTGLLRSPSSFYCEDCPAKKTVTPSPPAAPES